MRLKIERKQNNKKTKSSEVEFNDNRKRKILDNSEEISDYTRVELQS